MRGQDQHRQRVAALAQAAQHFQAVQSGQAQVQDQQRVVLRAEQVVGAAAVVHAVDREAGLAQGLAQGIGQHHVVFGKQDTHGAGQSGGNTEIRPERPRPDRYREVRRLRS
ncbi:hypothetical protein D3C72_1580120 [compost metagenome]